MSRILSKYKEDLIVLLTYLKENHTKFQNYREWAGRDAIAYQQLVAKLVHLGIRTISRGTWYVSNAHSESDIDQTLAQFTVALSG